MTFNLKKRLSRKRTKLAFTALLVIIVLTPLVLYLSRNPDTAEAAWWAGDGTGTWTKRKQLTVTNNSGDNLASGTTIAVTIDAKTLASSGKVQDDCDDLRVVYDTGSTQTELTRYISVAGNATCGASGAAKVHFPLQAALDDTNSTTDYYIYYGNPQASAPTNPDNAFDIGSKDALLVCPFDGTTTCAAGETPSTESGAVRYGGEKSAMSFDGRSDRLNAGSDSTLDDLPLGDFTVEYWFYDRGQPNTGYNGFFNKAGVGSEGWNIATQVTIPRRLRFKIDFSNTDLEYVVNSGSEYSYNTWNHAAIIFHSSDKSATIYINGEEITNLSISTNGDGTYVSGSTRDLLIGSLVNGSHEYNGIIDEVRISNIVRYSSNFTPPTTPFVRDEYTSLLYHFDENGDDPRNTGKAIDDSGNGNHGTIAGAKYVAGHVGVDNGTTDTGKADGGNTYAGHEGIFIEEGTTNKITNPSFENVSDWDVNWTASASATLTEETSAPYYKFGSSAAKMVVSGGDASLLTNINAGNTNDHTLSAYVYNGTSGSIGGTVNATVAQLHHDAVEVTTTYTDMGGGWWRLTATNPGTASSTSYGVEVKDTKTVYIDGVQLEEKDYATTYTDGSLTSSSGGADTYFWDDDCDGTLDAGEDETADQHAQCSSRLQEDNIYSTTGNLQTTAGMVSFWIKPNWEYDDNQQYTLFSTSNSNDIGNTNRVALTKLSAGNFLRFYIYDDTDFKHHTYTTPPLSAGKWTHIAVGWDGGGNLYMYLNGSSVGSTIGTGDGYPSSLPPKLAIGGHVYATYSTSTTDLSNSQFSDFRIYDDDLSAAEVTDLYYSGLVGHSEGIEVDAFSEEEGQNPVGIWHFDESYGSTAYDSSTYANHLTLSDTTWNTDSQNARSQLMRNLEFDGSTSVASVSGDLREFNFGTDGFSIGGWFRHNSSISGTDTLISRHGDAGYKVYMNSSGYICFGIDDDSTWGPPSTDEVCNATSLADSRWHHFEAVKDGTSSLTLYLDGIQVDQETSLTETGSLNSSANFAIGVDDDKNNYWSGFIDEIVVYPYARDASQVKEDVLGTQTAVSFGTQEDDWLTDGLVGYWKLDESSADQCTGGSNDSCDSSGNGNDGAWEGSATSAAGKFGNGATFDGNGDDIDYGDISDIMDGTRATMSIWVYPTAFTSAWARMMDAYGGSSWLCGFRLQSTTGIPDFNCDFTNAGTIFSQIGPALPTDTWTHLAWTYDGKYWIKYRNGAEVGRSTIENDTIEYFNEGGGQLPFTLGGDNIGQVSFEGTLDEARIYNRALSPAEVADLYEWAPGPVGYWNFDENTGSTVYDRSGNGNNGTISSPLWTQGKIGSSLDLKTDNSQTLATVSDPASGLLDFSDTQDFTVGVWLKWVEEGNSSFDPVFKGAGNLSDPGYALGGAWGGGAQSMGCYYIDGNGSGEDSALVLTTDLTDGGWHYFTCVMDRDGSEFGTVGYHLLSDGVVIASDTSLTEGSAAGSTKDLTFGEQDTGGGYNELGGGIDEVKIYNYARTQEQIIQDMNAGHPAPGSPVGSPVGYWKFDEGYGSNANDSGSSGNYDGTISGGVWSNEGKFGKAINLDTNTDYVTAGDVSFVDGLAAMSISLWINPTTLTTADEIIGKWDASATQSNFGIRTSDSNNDEVYYYIANSLTDAGGNRFSTNNLDLTAGTWQYLTFVYNGTLSANNRVKVFKNAQPISGSITGTIPTSMTSGSTSNLILGNVESVQLGLLAKYDEVKIYNFALTADQVKTEYNQGSAQVFGALSTDSSNSYSYSSLDSYCPPGQGSSCTAPVGEWLFDEKTGSNAQDTSENSYTGTINSGTWRHAGDCQSGSCLHFDRSDDYVLLSSENGNFSYDEYTLSAWVYRDQDGASQIYFIIDNRDGSDDGYRMHVNSNDDEFYCQYNGTNSISTGDAAAVNTWNHVTCVVDSSNQYLYVNGTLADSDPITPGISETTDMRIGSQAGAAVNLWPGMIDNVRVYNYARTPAQIAWEYNRGAPIAWWKLDECSGSTANDSGTVGVNGTITIGATGDNTSAGTCSSGTGTEAWNNGTTGKRSASLDFDGDDDYIEVADPGAGSILDFGVGDSISISAWVKPTIGGWQTVLTKGTSAGTENSNYMFQYGNGNILDFCFHDGTQYRCRGTLSIPGLFGSGEWLHMAVSATFGPGGSNQIYLNGVPIPMGGTFPTQTPTQSNDPIRIGGDCYTGCGAGSNQMVDGQLDEVKIYNYALTEEQVKLDYGQGAVSFE